MDLTMGGEILKLHAIMPVSRANGPGKRFCFWVQGCLKRCPGCFNSDTHSFDGGYEETVDSLFGKIIHTRGIEGISVSGGEPMLQAAALGRLLERIRNETQLSVLVFTGWSMQEIVCDKHARFLISCIDLLVSGPYKRELSITQPLRSSSNQEILFISGRYSAEDLENIWPIEIHIAEDGTIHRSGLYASRLKCI